MIGRDQDPSIGEATQFKEGESGNPLGKPKGTKHISTWIQELLSDNEFEASVLDKEYKGAPVKAIVHVAIIKSLNGDQRWAEWLAKYGYGTKQEIDVTSNGETVSQAVSKDTVEAFIAAVKDDTKQK